MPFLKKVLGDNFKIVPIIVGHITPKKADLLG
jgi:predicted class III extradiol MEMO1 family dioxygenase